MTMDGQAPALPCPLLPPPHCVAARACWGLCGGAFTVTEGTSRHNAAA